MSHQRWCNDDVIPKSKIKSRNWLWLVQKRNNLKERDQRKCHRRSTKINSDANQVHPGPKQGFEDDKYGTKTTGQKPYQFRPGSVRYQVRRVQWAISDGYEKFVSIPNQGRIMMDRTKWFHSEFHDQNCHKDRTVWSSYPGFLF